MFRQLCSNLLCFSLILLGGAGPLLAQSQSPSVKKSPPEIAAISEAMQGFVASGDISGAVTLVAHEGKIVHLSAVGLADIESNTPMRRNALFSIASMTKPITATAVMILQDDGQLSVDDKVSEYLPAYASLQVRGGTPPAREITIRDALTHTAGLSGNQLFSSSLAEAVDELSKRPLDFQPGTKWQYSPGLNIAGRIVEVVSGQPFEQFLRERIFEPLRMKHTTFFPDEELTERVATLYTTASAEGDDTSLQAIPNRIAAAPEQSPRPGPNPSGGLYSTARDLFRFYQAILNGGNLRNSRIVSREAVQQMLMPQTGQLKTGFTPGNCWGLGWCIVREPQGVTEMLSAGTFGHGGAFGTQGWVDPRTETIYVLLIQRDKLPNSDASEMRRVFQQIASDALEH